jgi:hypothetical protein
MALLFLSSLAMGYLISFSFPAEEVSQPESFSNVIWFLISFGIITAIFMILIRTKLETIFIHVYKDKAGDYLHPCRHGSDLASPVHIKILLLLCVSHTQIPLGPNI